jgi:hypothetical protein
MRAVVIQNQESGVGWPRARTGSSGTVGLWMTLLIIVETFAMAGNAPTRQGLTAPAESPSCAAPCILGPLFYAAGDTAEYAVTEVTEPLTVAAEDSCLPGDVYLLTVRRQYGAPKIAIIDGSQVVGCTCAYSTLTVDHVTVTAKGSGPGKVRVKALKLPNSGSASLYLAFQQGLVTQTLGEDSCW